MNEKSLPRRHGGKEDKNRRGDSIKSEIDWAFTLTLRNEPISDLMERSVLGRKARDFITPSV